MPILKKTIEYLFYLFIFLLPWQTRWIWHYGELNGEASQYLTLGFYGTEILLLVILLLAIIFRLVKPDPEMNAQNKKIADYYVMIFLLAGLALFSIIWAGDKMSAAYYALKLAEGIAILVLVINVKMSNFQIAGAFVLSGLGQAILAIIQFATQKVWASKWLGMAEQLPQTLGVSVIEANGARFLRAYGALPHPNVLAGYLVVSCLLLVVLIILARHKWEKIFLWLCLPVILTGLFLTFSKSAFLALGCGLLFFGFYIYLSDNKQMRKTLQVFIGSLVIILAILGYVWQSQLSARFDSANRLEIKSQSERISYFNQAKDLIKQNFLLGTGIGNYTVALFNQDQNKQPAWYYQPVHNVYLLVFAEMGVFGSLIFIILIFSILRGFMKICFKKEFEMLKIFSLFPFKGIYHFYLERTIWFLGWSAVILALLVMMMIDHWIWTSYFGLILFWLCLGLWLKQMILMK